MRFSITDFAVKKKLGAIFEFKPKKTHALEFEPIVDKLRKHSITITVETTDLIIARFLKAKITVFRSGTIIIENAKTEEKAKIILKKFLAIIN